MVQSNLESPLVAALPLAFFKGASSLIDSKNLNFIHEYFLLENLSSGLVFEDWQKKEIWVPRFAEKWEKLSPKRWLFKIRKNIYWSDGSSLTLQQIADHFERLRKSNSRHTCLLKKIESIKINPAENTFIFDFKVFIHEGLLREMSLAESLILHPKNIKGDWSVTSGPYFVSSHNASEVILKANPYFIENIDIKNVLIKNANFDRNDIEIRKKPVYAVDEDVKNLSKKFKVIKHGQPTILYYFSFNPKNSMTSNSQIRKAFSKYIHDAFQNFKYQEVLIFNYQMIPKGCEGRLKQEVELSAVDVFPLQKNRINLKLNKYLRDVLLKNFYTSAKKYDIDLNLIIDSEYSDDFFAEFIGYQGNQKDPLSSWQYLYGEGGPLHFFYPEVKDLFEQIISAEGETRNQLLLDLHRKTLEEAYVVPFLAEYDAILASDRVDLSNINPYDMRLRFFEMKWKK